MPGPPVIRIKIVVSRPEFSFDLHCNYLDLLGLYTYADTATQKIMTSLGYLEAVIVDFLANQQDIAGIRI